MNTTLVSSIDAVTRSRLVTISADASLVDAAKLLSDTQISLVVVCNSDGTMVGGCHHEDQYRSADRSLRGTRVRNPGR